jgi:hypothetical protein
MPPADLPGNNYNAPIGNEDMKFEQSIYRDEFLNRLRLVFGHPDFISDSAYGIVAEEDPASSTATSGPLRCTASTTDLTVSVTAGIAVTKSGHWIYLETSQSEVGMSTNTVGEQNVITLKFSTKNPDERAPNEFGIPVFKRRLDQDDSAKVVAYSMAEWNALSTEQKDDHVPLALAVVTASGSSSVLSLIQTNTSYTWLRPWFSALDVRHRQMIGSGTVSETNPHGISFNELTVGNFTLPMLTSHWGRIVARDVSFANVPGQACEVVIPAGLIKTDDGSGTETGVPNTKYIDLDFYPVQVGLVSDNGTAYCFVQQQRTQRIYQPLGVALVPPATDVLVRATKVATLEPNGLLTATTSKTKFTAGDIDPNDAVVASGKVYVSTMSVNLEDDYAADAGPLTLAYREYFAAGELVRNPQVIVCATKVSSITGSGIVPSITPFDKGTIVAGLSEAAGGASMQVQVKITGTDPDGVAVEETLTFDSSWSQGTPGSVNLASFKKGTTVFATIDAITIPVHLNEGPNALLQIWIAMDPTRTELAYATPIADVLWNGSQMIWVQDIRQIHYDLQLPEDSDGDGLAAAIHHAFIEETGLPRNLRYLESFLRPRYHGLSAPDTPWPDMNAAATIGLTDRTLPTLDAYYYSTALALSATAVSISVYFYPPLYASWHRSHAMTLGWSAQDSGGSWSSWSNIPNLIDRRFSFDLPADSRAIRFMVVGTDLRGMAVIEYIAP